MMKHTFINGESVILRPACPAGRSRRFSAGPKDLNGNYRSTDFKGTDVTFAQRQIFRGGV